MWRSLRDRKYQTLIFSIASVAFLEMYIALFPALQKQSQQMAKLLETYPDSMWKAFNIDKSSLVFDKVGPYLGMEQFNFIWPIMAVILGIGFAGYAFANEVEKGTVEVLLSQPVDRMRIFAARYLTGLLNIAIFTMVSILAIFPLTAMHQVSVNAKGVLLLTLVSFLFAWAIYSIAILASVFFSEKSKVSFVGGGLLILMYVLNILAGLKESLSNLQYLSFFHYYNATQIIDKATTIEWTWLVFLGVIIISTSAAGLWFNRRDVAV